MNDLLAQLLGLCFQYKTLSGNKPKTNLQQAIDSATPTYRALGCEDRDFTPTTQYENYKREHPRATRN